MVNTNGNYGSINVQHQRHLSTEVVDKDSLVPPSKRHRHVKRRRTLLLFAAGIIALLLSLTWLIYPTGGNTATFQDDNDDTVDLLPVTDKRLKENHPLFFTQTVDHFDDTNTDTWLHRYYAQSKYFKGPGHPIFLVVGGEGGNDAGFFYAFVEEHLASTFGAYALHPEHRFYGPYRPTNDTSSEALLKLLTPQQAMADMLTIAQHYQRKLGCSFDRTSKKYCPLITVGGSYPGFLASIMRLLYPDVVDIGYGSSAPLKLYSQESSQFGYFDIVTSSAEKVSKGCAAAVNDTLNEIDAAIRNHSDFTVVANKLNICNGSIPKYIDSNDLFSKEIMQIVADTWADLNMFNYNKIANQTKEAKMCYLFQNKSLDSYGKLAEFWKRLEFNIDPNLPCFNMSSQLPAGKHATISGGDWSGVGPGMDGMMFDFQCCTTLTPAVGYSRNSMFPYRKWTLEWLTQHCRNRFNVVPRPTELVNEWKFDDLVGQGATRILFTNGLNDLWSAGSYLEDLSDSILAINMPNGAHHSELRHTNAQNLDTKDVKEAHDEITKILSRWLKEVRSERIS